MKRIAALLLGMLLLCLPLIPAGAEGGDNAVQDILDGILSYQLGVSGTDSLEAWISGPLAEDAGVGAEWYVLGLTQSGYAGFADYQQKLIAYLEGHTVRAAVTRQKYALALIASGGDAPFVTDVMAETIGKQGVMSWVFGLHLMNNGCESTAADIETAIETLLSLQKEDGGWAVTGDSSDTDVTAMTIQALAPHRNTPTVAQSVARAMTLLSQRQATDGGYSSYGISNPESAAQVLIALSALGTDALKDERFIKEGHTILDGMLPYRLEDGSFSHTLGGETNGMATSQVYDAMVAYQRFLNGQGSLYLLDRAGEAEAVPAKAELSWQAIALMAIAGAAVVVCILLLMLRKRHWKNFAAVLVVAALTAAFVLTTDFQTADSYYTAVFVAKRDAIGSVTLSIRCDTVAGETDYIPQDGVILPETSFPIAQGDNVYTILTEAAQAHGILLENTGAKGMAYMAGIAHLYEYSFGDLSGWVYAVNGASPSVSCEQYVLQDGDSIQWLYSRELGHDLDIQVGR